MKDAAAKIAEKYAIGEDWGLLKRDRMMRDINRIIRRAVQAERKRCLGIVKSNTLPTFVKREAIITAINATAKAMEER